MCQGYIDGTLEDDWTIDEIVDMCMEMRWLFEYTDYKTELDKAIRREKEIHGFFVYDETEPFVREKVINKWGGKPEVMPWQK